MDEGYGLNDERCGNWLTAARRWSSRWTAASPVVQQAETAAELGLELIVTDHHELADRLPDAAAIVHPRLPGHDYPFGGLCGAGVAFKLAWALCQRASEASGSARADARVSDARPWAWRPLGPWPMWSRCWTRTASWFATAWSVCASSRTSDWRRLLKVTNLDQKPRLTSEDIGFHAGAAAECRRTTGAGPAGRRTVDNRDRATGPIAWPNISIS